MQTGLAGRVAVVSGASQGLGRAIAKAFAAEGARVALCARNLAKLEMLVSELREHHGTEGYVESVDVTQPQVVGKFIANTLERFGQIDVAIANAGGPPSKSFLETSESDWERAFETNLLSIITLARSVLPIMQQRRWGRIVTISSMSVRQPLPRLVLSNTIRTGVLGLIRTLSNEFAKDGITVNNVGPGYTATDRLKQLSTDLAKQNGTSIEQVEKQWIAEIPAGRLGQPEEIADAVLWLASERASFITGQTLLVDGGMYKGV